jgi:2-amino-4-hydroxy-6-hydroxymethyldihydropteridine diphosphokinase
MNAAFLCLGGNMGDRLAYLDNAKKRIETLCGKITATSLIYETQAWGDMESPDYYNQCLRLETNLSATTLLSRLLGIEKEMGRIRTSNRNEARTMDIDILLFNNDIINEEHCHIPHPRMHLRRFVLEPLNDIAPGAVHPILHKTVARMLEECPDTNLVKLVK